jgi:hypothetical protein
LQSVDLLSTPDAMSVERTTRAFGQAVLVDSERRDRVMGDTEMGDPNSAGAFQAEPARV